MPAAPEEPKADALFEQAVQDYRQGHFQEAANGFKSVLKQEARDAHAQFNLALCEERLGKPAEAVTAYEAALQVNSAHVPSLLNLGRLYLAEGRGDKAIALYEGALRPPGHEFDAQVLNALSRAYRLGKRYPEAESAARKVLSRSVDNVDAYKNLTLIYYEQGNFHVAEHLAQRAKRLAEKDPDIYNSLGMIYLKRDDVPRAVLSFKKAVELDPDYAPAYRNLGALALTYRDFAAAQKDFSKLLALRPDEISAVCGAGWAYAQDAVNGSEAKALLKRCMEAKETSAEERQAAQAKIAALGAVPAPSASKEANVPAPADASGGTPP